jgi:DtxR family Mn-dependent transcriptional regulator
MASLTIENYVKAIYKLTRGDSRTAPTGRLAEELQVSPGTVTTMLKALQDSGFAHYTPYEGVQLTEAGQSLALRVLRRHRLESLNAHWPAVSGHPFRKVRAFFILGYPLANAVRE